MTEGTECSISVGGEVPRANCQCKKAMLLGNFANIQLARVNVSRVTGSSICERVCVFILLDSGVTGDPVDD